MKDQGVGEGLSELNPAVMEEMARLRNENLQLKAFAAKREDDSVQMLEERLDDTQRLSVKYKDQFLSTKKDLERTQGELRESKEHVVDLEKQVDRMAERVESLGQELGDCKDQLFKCQDALANTSQELKDSLAREEALRTNVDEWTQKANDFEALSTHRLEMLESMKSELDDTATSLNATQEREQRLLVEVSEWTEKTNAAETAFAQCEQHLEQTKKELDEAASSLDAALQREVGLKDDVTGLETLKSELEDKMAEEIRSKEEALLAAENELKKSRQNLEERAQKELDELREDMNQLLENERATLQKELATASEAYAQLERQSAIDCSQLEEKYHHELEAARNEAEEKLAQVEEKLAKEIDSVKQAADEERTNLVKKGKAMLKDAKERAETELADIEDELHKVKDALSESRKEYEAYEKRAKTKIASYKQKLNFASGRVTELSQSNDNMEDTIKELEREKFKLQEENERFRRQLGGRFGADGKVQNQLETLQKEFNAILDENRALKKENERMSNPENGMLSSISESSEVGGARASYTRGGVSGSTLSQLRKEYEETIEVLTDEKRELVMRNSAAITDVQKAEQRAWESDKQVAKLKEELTSLRLALQRLERDSEDGRQDDSFEDDTKENAFTPPVLTSLQSSSHLKGASPGKQVNPAEILLDMSASSDHAMPLSSSTHDNRTARQSTITESENAPIHAYDFSPARTGLKRRSLSAKKPKAEHAPTLMEYARSDSTPEDGQSECKQS